MKPIEQSMNISSDNCFGDNRITTALLLAAGTGSRLFPLTKSSPKCLTLVNEKSIVERPVDNIKKARIYPTCNCYRLRKRMYHGFSR